MAASISAQQRVYDNFTIPTLGSIYDITGLVASDKPAPTGKTVLNITLPATYKYIDATFKFSTSDTFASEIAYDSVDSTTTAGIITVTFTSTNLTAGGSYYMTFDITK
ncbi:hypothetical protein [Clostridium sp. C2-6-12]|uniref:hypothetical protein n=1 Tax=Clostridium sp. C2-6-12 TaxID=2698832 RepID=UPI00136E9767|nr:hypothetical protein [Clostridium sp. C2-6-12]